MTDTAFVAGATGYTGRAVVAALRRAGVDTLAHVRPDSSALARWQTEFGALGATVDTTPWSVEALTRTFERARPSVIFALLGTTRRRGAQDGGTYATVDYGLTAMLLAAAKAAGIAPRFVYLSSMGVGPGGRRDSYLEVRWRFEQDLIASGLPYVIARPSFITGPDRDESRPMERIGAQVGDAVLGLAGVLGGRGLRDKYASTTAEILGGALVRLARSPAVVNTIAEGSALR